MYYFEKNIDEAKYIEDQKPLNVIIYIAKKLVSSSFSGSFNFQYASAKKYLTVRSSSAITHNHLLSNENLFANKESNPINEEIEYMRENSNTSNNGSNNKINNNENNVNKTNVIDLDNIKIDNIENINDINFKNLISVLNQKFLKYLIKNKISNNNINNQDEKKESVDLNNTNSNHNSNTNPINSFSKNK